MKLKKLKKYAHNVVEFEKKMQNPLSDDEADKMMTEFAIYLTKNHLSFQDLDEIDAYIQSTGMLDFDPLKKTNSDNLTT